jgi:hypothetical protein
LTYQWQEDDGGGGGFANIVDGGIYAGNKGGSVSNDQIRADGDISTAGGVYAGSVSGNPGTGEVTATGDIRTDGGVYAGNKAGSVSNDQIIADGEIKGSYFNAGSPSSPASGAGDFTAADDIHAEGNLSAAGNIYTTVWTAYHDSSSITGWSSYSTKEIWYKKVGELVFVWFDLNGTSNSTSTSFTLPHSNNSDVLLSSFLVAQNNGSWSASWCSMSTSSSTVTCYPSVGGGSTSWTSSGSKTARGHFVFET